MINLTSILRPTRAAAQRRAALRERTRTRIAEDRAEAIAAEPGRRIAPRRTAERLP